MVQLRTLLKIILPWAFLICMPSTLFALTVSKLQNLSFGQVIVGTGYPGSVTVGTSGERYAAGGVKVLGNESSLAKFEVSGVPGEPYLISFPASLTISSGGDYMDITGMLCSVPVRGVVPSGGGFAFTIGGTLTVKAVQSSSTTYTGNLAVSVAGN